MKIKEINGYLYSRTSFTTYKLRLMVEFIDTDGYENNIIIYTSCNNIEEITAAINTIITDKVVSFKIISKNTRESDDATSKLINEHLNEF